MNLNHLNRAKIRRNARWLSRLSVLTVAFSGLLTGCHPCSIPGVCEAPSATEIVAYMGDDGAIYFDIPARKNYKRAELTDITIFRVDAEEFAIPYCAMSKRDFTDQGKRASQAQDMPWPLRYGKAGPLTEIFTRPKEIENGKYRIDGAVRLYDEKGKNYFELVGDFRYENGAVHDYSTE